MSDRFDRALVLASRLHRDQPRKGTEIPYVSHLLAVASLVIEAGGDEEQAIAALLHDALEDQPNRIEPEDIAARFGERVLAIVDACTDEVPEPPEDTSEPVEARERSAANWEARKKAYLEHLKTAHVDVLLVSCADKLHNARAIARDLEVVGEKLWDRFHAGRAETLWYYKGLVAAFRSRGVAPEWLLDELEVAVERMEKPS